MTEAVSGGSLAPVAVEYPIVANWVVGLLAANFVAIVSSAVAFLIRFGRKEERFTLMEESQAKHQSRLEDIERRHQQEMTKLADLNSNIRDLIHTQSQQLAVAVERQNGLERWMRDLDERIQEGNKERSSRRKP